MGSKLEKGLFKSVNKILSCERDMVECQINENEMYLVKHGLISQRNEQNKSMTIPHR